MTGPIRAELAERGVPHTVPDHLLDVAETLLGPLYELIVGIGAHLDPALAPPDVLRWTRAALGVEHAGDLPLERVRQVLATIVEAYRWRGTAHGLRLELEARYGCAVRIEDPGGTTWSTTPGTVPPDTGTEVTVLVDGVDPLPELANVIRSGLPAQLTFTIHRNPHPTQPAHPA
jgi:phage tail-like protein